MILLGALVAAEVAEVADRAVVDRPRPRVALALLARDRGQQPLPAPAEEGDELGSPQRRALARAELDVDVLGQPSLDPPELLGVEAELDRVERLRRARELRVDRLVGAVGQPHEEVGEPAPGSVREVGLVDDVGFRAPDGLLGRAPRLVGVEALVVVGLEPQNA